MILKKLLLTGVAILSLASASIAQDVEGGIFLGTSNYQGDLTHPHAQLKRTKPSLGLLGRYYFGPRFNLKGSFTYGWISGTDADDASDQRYRDKRNLSFRSNLMELSIQGELNILPFISNSKRYRFAPYVFAGIALFHFNPVADIVNTNPALQGSKWDGLDLQTLGTEGQNLQGSSKSAYSRWQGSIPYGLGIKYSLGNFWNVGLELGQRKLFTDYLDDASTTYPDMNALQTYSRAQFGDDRAVVASNPRDFTKYPTKTINDVKGYQRANSKKNDMYIFVGLTITKTLRRFSCTNF